jgi:hypothetical protein
MTRRLLTCIISLAAIIYVAQFTLRSQNNSSATLVNAPPAVAFRIAFGVGDKAPARWDGSLQVSGGQMTPLEGWRFGPNDQVAPNGSWKLATAPPAPGAETALGPIAEKGLVVTVVGGSEDTRVDAETSNGRISFTAQHVPFGAPLQALGGRVRIERLPATLPLTTSADDQDYPALAASRDNVYLTYIEFSHGDRSLESQAAQKDPAADFNWLSRPAGGDQVKAMKYSKSLRKWSEAENVSPPHEDCMRSAVAVDGRGRVWVIWSANRGGNFDLYARYREGNRWSKEIRLTEDPGVDINPVATTDSAGHVWVAWQAFRGTNLDVLVSAQSSADRFTREQRVSFSPSSDWDPAIAAGPNGEVAVTWDTYDKGDYDVYARTMRYYSKTKSIEMEKRIAVAASENFEARSSAAYDRQGRLWVAYESSGRKWGKDFGVYEKNGICLYLGHTLRVKCIQGGSAFETAGSLEDALRGAPGLTGREGPPQMAQVNPGMAGATQPGPRNSIPRIAAGEDGRIFLTFRSGAGQRSGVGSIYQQYLTWYDGSQWSRAVELPRTDGPVDFRAAIHSIGADGLLLVGITDHRKPAAGALGEEAATGGSAEVNTDLVMAELPFSEPAKELKLRAVPPETPAAPAVDTLSERQAIGALHGSRVNLAGEQLQLMRGEFHRHTEFSLDGGADGPLIDAYRYLIDAAQMDWGGCCDHDNGGGREYAWWIQQKLTDAYHLSGAYVPMFSYERSVAYPEGHRNVIFAGRGVRPLPRLPKTAPNSPAEPAPDTQMLYRYLRQYKGIAASHTTATQMGTDWRDNDPVLEPVVEIYQGERQNYEMPGAPRSPEEKNAIGGWRPLGFVSLALKKGFRLGFESSSDHISTHMSYCNLWVKSRTREGVMEAFRKRRIYGATDNILADVRCGEHFMGEEFSVASEPVLRVHLVGTADFSKVHVIRDGAVVYISEPNSKEVSFEWRDSSPPATGSVSYYYVRGEQKDGELVWASPMWIHRQ